MNPYRAPEVINSQFGKILQKYRIRRRTTDSNSPGQNRAKGDGVKTIKKIERWLLQRYSSLLRLYDYAYEFDDKILSRTCKYLVFGEHIGIQVLTKNRPDILEYASFHVNSWVLH